MNDYKVTHPETGIVKIVGANNECEAVSNFCLLLSHSQEVELLECDSSWEQVGFNLETKKLKIKL